MIDHAFEQLGPDDFQRLCQALLLKAYPRLRAFPTGQADGGRDATAPLDGGRTAVFQVKFTAYPDRPDAVQRLLRTVLNEAPNVGRLKAEGATEYHLITNVRGSGAYGSGAMDDIPARLTHAFGIPVSCLWRDDLNRRLDESPDLRWQYPELLSGLDVLREVVRGALAGEHRERRSDALRAYVAAELRADAEVRFRQVDLQHNLLDLFVDVPAHFGPGVYVSHGLEVIRSLLVRAGAAPLSVGLDNVGGAELLLSGATQRELPRIVIEGAPGQGKSTLTQYVCQAHRLHFLGRTDDLRALPAAHIRALGRLPFRIEARDLAAWLVGDDPFTAPSPTGDATPPAGPQAARTLETFLAKHVEIRSGGVDFGVSDLIAVCKVTAPLIVVDGLDEVADSRDRSVVAERLDEGLARLVTHAPALQVVVTTRPSALGGSPQSPGLALTPVSLGSVPPLLATTYARRWARARGLSDSEQRELVETLASSLTKPHLRDLARNPMQLAILLTLIYTRGVSLPDKRTALYSSYVDIFFNREAAKHRAVREHRDLLLDLHGYLAWTLHAAAEAEGASGRISVRDLRRVVLSFLSERDEPASIVEDLFAGVTQRILALVSRVDGSFEFEVQPLREYFAARYLYETAPYSPPGDERSGTLPDRFDALVRGPYWLNVTRFYAGFYSRGELPSLVDRLEEFHLARPWRFSSLPRTVTLNLLADWTFSQDRRVQGRAVALLLAGIGRRHALGTRRGRYLSGTLALPERCGARDVLQSAFVALAEDPFDSERRDELIALIGAHDVDLARAAWLGVHPNDDGFGRWLLAGSLSGQTNAGLPSAEGRAIAGGPADDTVLEAVLESGWTGWTTEEAWLEQAADGVLDGRFTAFPRPGSSLLARLRVVLWSLPERLAPDHRVDDEPAGSPTLNAAREILRVNARWDAEASWRMEFAPWNDVVEVARDHFGDRWALFSIAVAAAGVGHHRRSAKHDGKLFAPHLSLCTRARYARYRADSSAWWQEQLESAPGTLEAMFASSLALAWATVNTLNEIGPLLSERVALLSDDDFQLVLETIKRSSDVQAWRGVGHPFLATGKLDDLHPRVAAALTLRVPEKSAFAPYEQWLRGYDGDDVTVSAVCMHLALRTTRDDPERSREALTLAERTETLRRRGSPIAGRGTSTNWPDRLRLGPAPVEAVLTRPEAFPFALVARCEALAEPAVSSAVESVPAVATREGWFDSARGS